MEGQIDSHQWASKIESHRFISGRPKLEMEAKEWPTGREFVGTHFPSGKQSKRICAFLKSQAVRIKRLSAQLKYISGKTIISSNR